jgi:hypothetical protein
MKQLLVLICTIFWMSFCLEAVGQQSATLAWNQVTNPIVTGYVLYYGNATQDYTVTNNVGTNTTVTLTNLQPGTNYYFAVASYTADGMQSPLSTEVALSTPPIAFFSGQELTNGEEWLEFPDGNPFGYYSYLGQGWINHADLGYEYYIDAQDGNEGVYLFDFDSDGFWYTSPGLFPYLFDFSLNAWLYYYPDTSNPGHYTSNPRTFFNYTTSQVVTE